MSLLTENVTPGAHGKVFSTNASKEVDLAKIKATLLAMEGVKEVSVNTEVYPKEFTIYTSEIVSVKAIEETVISIGFHLIPKHTFGI